MSSLGPSPETTVWLDLTVLIYTKSTQPTGIPRTIVRIFHDWVQRGFTNLRFCALDEKRGVLVEVDANSVLARFPIHSVAAPVSAHPSGPPEVSRWNLLRESLRNQARNLPFRVRHLARQAAMVAKSLLRVGQRVQRIGVRSSRFLLKHMLVTRSRVPVAPPLKLSPADIVISLGGGWLVADSSEIIWRLKQEQGFRFAMLIYDIIPVKFPHFFGPGMAPCFRHWNTNTVWTSNLLFSISQHTARDLREFAAATDVPLPPIEVLRLGEDISGCQDSCQPPPHPFFHGDKPFVLTVGTIEVRKNHILLYQVWRRLIEKVGADNTPNLVLVGSRGWLTEDLLYQIHNDPLTRDKILILMHTNDGQLRWLYRHCLFTVYPSHYEGWGLPIAESLGFGKYCIASNTSSMPEVGGDLVGRHDPQDGQTCLQLILKALDESFRTRQEERIRREYRPVSWAETARDLVRGLEAHFGPVFHKEVRDASDEGVTGWAIPHSTTYTRRSA